MVEVTIVNEKNIESSNAYLQRLNISYDFGGKITVVAIEHGKIRGLMGGVADGSTADIELFDFEDGFDFLLGKSLLNVLDRRAISCVTCGLGDKGRNLKTLGFESLENGTYSLNLQNYFDCGCKK